MDIENDIENESLREYCGRIGSAFVVAYYRQSQKRKTERLNLAEETASRITKKLLDDQNDWDKEADLLNVAFDLFQQKLRNEEKEIASKISEIFAIGYQEGTHPATAEIFVGHGLAVPTSEDIKQFFWDGD
jgi:hypothetical protein